MVQFAEIPTDALLECVESNARVDRGDDDDEYWTLVRELHRRGDDRTYEKAIEWCSAADSKLRALGADVLSQLGCLSGHPFADQSAATLDRLLDDDAADVVCGAVTALGHLKRGSLQRMFGTSPNSEYARETLERCRSAARLGEGGEQDHD